MAWCWRPIAVMPKSGFFSTIFVSAALCSWAATEAPRTVARKRVLVGARMLVLSIPVSDGDWLSRFERGEIIAQRSVEVVRLWPWTTNFPGIHGLSLPPCDRPKRWIGRDGGHFPRAIF